MSSITEENKLIYASRKGVAITAIAEAMLNPVQQEKVKTALRLRGYEKALEGSRALEKAQGGRRRASIANSPGSEPRSRSNSSTGSSPDKSAIESPSSPARTLSSFRMRNIS